MSGIPANSLTPVEYFWVLNCPETPRFRWSHSENPISCWFRIDVSCLLVVERVEELPQVVFVLRAEAVHSDTEDNTGGPTFQGVAGGGPFDEEHHLTEVTARVKVLAGRVLERQCFRPNLDAPEHDVIIFSKGVHEVELRIRFRIPQLNFRFLSAFDSR